MGRGCAKFSEDDREEINQAFLWDWKSPIAEGVYSSVCGKKKSLHKEQ